MPNCMSLEFKNITYTGGPINDTGTFEILPDYLQQFYLKQNGLICFDGALHIRGCVQNPIFHSLNEFWFGKHALADLFSSITKNDIPFAQDFLGDQYLIRGNEIIHLQSEFDEIENLRISFEEFIARSIQNTNNFLLTEPLRFYLKSNSKLVPGQLLSVFPPYCIETESERHFGAVDAIEHLHYLSDLARQIKIHKDGTSIKFKME